MDNNSYEGRCVSCGLTIVNISYSPTEIIYTCSKCGGVINYQPIIIASSN